MRLIWSLLLVVDVVKIEELADLLEAEAEALALQDQFQPRPAAPCIEAAGAFTAGCDEFLGFVKPEGAGGHAEFGAHLANGQKGVAHAFSIVSLLPGAQDGPAIGEVQDKRMTFASS